jgi:hypothetical protein
MDDELEADVDEDVADDVADDVAIVDMSATWHMTWRPRGATRGRFCCCRVADFVADTWQKMWHWWRHIFLAGRIEYGP